jgi:hypothetical protein
MTGLAGRRQFLPPGHLEKQSRINRLGAARLLLNVKATARQGNPLGRSLGSGLE